MCSLKIHDNVLLSRVPNECEHNSLYAGKVKPVNKIHAQSCKIKVQSSNLNNKVPERLQRCSGIEVHIK